MAYKPRGFSGLYLELLLPWPRNFEENVGRLLLVVGRGVHGWSKNKSSVHLIDRITRSKQHFFTPLIPVYKHWERRSPGMLPAPAGEKKTLSSMNWPSCCLFLQPSLASLTRPPSFDLQSATWKWGTLLTRGTLHGTCEWKALHLTHQ